MKKLIYLFTIVVCFTSCHIKLNNEQKTKSPKPFIQVFNVPSGYFQCSYVSSELCDYLRVNFNSNISYSRGEMYDYFCERYNDKDCPYYSGQFAKRAIAPEFTFINVTCDTDIDEDHPAGTSLNDIMRLHGFSAYEYIQNGYKSRSDEDEYPKDYIEIRNWAEFGFQRVTMMLNDLKLDDLKLIDFEVYLQFLRELSPGTYNFTVTFRNENGDLTTTTSAEIG